MSDGPQDLVERALAASKADSCVVLADETVGANFRWASNTLTTNGLARQSEITVIAIIGGAAGVVARQGITTDTVEDAVRLAEAAARSGPPAEDQNPLLPGLVGGTWSEPPEETSISVFSQVAHDLGEAFRRASGSDQLLFGFADHEVRTIYLGSSSGLRARHVQPTGHVEINAKSSDYARSAWLGVPAPDFKAVDVESMTADLSRRLEWSRRSVDLPPGRYQTVLPPSAVADLMIYLYWSAGARHAHEGRTVFARPGGGTRVGERLSGAPVSLRSDPASPAIECSPFLIAHSSRSDRSVFDNGAELGPTDWISGGVLRSLVQTRHSARLTELPFTPYIDNLIMDGEDPAGDVEQVIRGVDFGLLLTCLWYIREVDPQTLLLTGLTRDGVYLIQGGEITGAVNNFRFNESPVDLLDRIVKLGPSERTLPREWCDYFTRVAMPFVHVGDFNMSSVSQAS